MSDDDDVTLWVGSERSPEGTYITTVNYGQDIARTLNRDEAKDYAQTCVARAIQAEHDSALFALFKGMGVSFSDIAKMIAEDLRPDRPVDEAATAPFGFEPAVGMKGPFIHFTVNGKPTGGHLSTGKLKSHALDVLSALAAADLDQAFYRFATGALGQSKDRAAAVVSSLGSHWPTDAQIYRTDYA